MQKVNAQVTEIAGYNQETFSGQNQGEIAQLLDTEIGSGAGELIAKNIAQTLHGGVYLVTWHGQKAPIGAVVGGQEVSGAQSGALYGGTKKGIIGTYQRFEDPTDTLQQKMLVHLTYNG